MPMLDPTPIRVLVVAEPLPRFGLEQLLHAGGSRCECVGAATALREALPMLESKPVDVVVFADDGAHASELTDFCAAAAAKVLLVTGSHDQGWQDQAILAGARGVVRAEEAVRLLTTAVERLSQGELWIERSATGRLFMEMVRRKAQQPKGGVEEKIATLTLRERETALAVASAPELPAKVIATRLCISEHTLRNHLTSIYSKLDLRNRAHLSAYANQHRLQERYGPVATSRATPPV